MSWTDASLLEHCEGDFPLAGVDPNNNSLTEGMCAEDEMSSILGFEGIVGQSSALREVLEQVEMVAPTDSTVLLLGETGTGKELIARAIHDRSFRKKRSLVKVNCAAIPAGLLESELFGHERGAYTGAMIQRIGRLEVADQGSLFLDEIGDIPLELQPKLLRVLQEQEFERLGSTVTKKINVRIVAATHRHLERMVREKQFRSDLYYRLNVFPIYIPPLRERPEDIPPLVRHFVHDFARRMNRKIDGISSKTMGWLSRYSWPGNIRELQNVIERSMVVHKKGTFSVKPRCLPHATLHIEESEVPMASSSPFTYREAESSVIIDALRAAAGRIAGKGGAAERLGLKRTTLQNKIRRLGISKAQYQS